MPLNLFGINIPINTASSALTYSGAYRIFNVGEAISNAQYLHNINNIFNYGNNNPNYLTQYFRYSLDNSYWSQWYNINQLQSQILFNQNSSIYIGFKIAYDNGTNDTLETPITLREINAQFATEKPKASLRTTNYTVSDELSTSQYVNKNVQYNLFNMDSLVAMNKAFSNAMMNFIGVDSVYISTSPDKDGIDYVFREYTILNYKDMKCCKVVAEDNNFPDDDFKVSGEGLMSVNFIVHIDKEYFQDIFGAGAEPRKGDVIYVSITDKVFVVTKSKMKRGVMNQPIYWMLSMAKYENSTIYNKNSNPPVSQFLDDITLTTDEAYGSEYDKQVKDPLLTQQFQPKTSTFKDLVRDEINVEIHQSKVDFNYNRLIDYHYYCDTTNPIAVNYVNTFNVDANNNDISLSAFVRLGTGFSSTNIFYSTDNKLQLNASYNSATSILKLSLLGYEVECDEMSVDEWYSFFVVVSPTFKQIRFVVYSMPPDPKRNGYFKFNIKGKAVYDNVVIDSMSDVKLNIGSGLYDIANIRVFNRGIDEEKQQLSLSQLICKEEKLLHIVDNCRPVMDRPFVNSKY